jgi:hypothetical protein
LQLANEGMRWINERCDGQMKGERWENERMWEANDITKEQTKW